MTVLSVAELRLLDFIQNISNPVFDLIATILNYIAANGEITKIDQWGKRRMAYAIDDMAEGYYVLVEFDSKPDFPAELDRIYKITDGVMRSIIVSLDD